MGIPGETLLSFLPHSSKSVLFALCPQQLWVPHKPTLLARVNRQVSTMGCARLTSELILHFGDSHLIINKLHARKINWGRLSFSELNKEAMRHLGFMTESILSVLEEIGGNQREGLPGAWLTLPLLFHPNPSQGWIFLTLKTQQPSVICK